MLLMLMDRSVQENLVVVLIHVKLIQVISNLFSFEILFILGGPLMVENGDNRWEVVGITSFGKSW